MYFFILKLGQFHQSLKDHYQNRERAIELIKNKKCEGIAATLKLRYIVRARSMMISNRRNSILKRNSNAFVCLNKKDTQQRSSLRLIDGVLSGH